MSQMQGSDHRTTATYGRTAPATAPLQPLARSLRHWKRRSAADGLTITRAGTADGRDKTTPSTAPDWLAGFRPVACLGALRVVGVRRLAGQPPYSPPPAATTAPKPSVTRTVTSPLVGSGALELAVGPAAEGSVLGVIGSLTLTDADVGGDIQTVRFLKNGADYELSYEVAMHMTDHRSRPQ
ncbi:hypothetical protein ACFWTC_36440 [Streptomyces sp. NPDC058619]|uniref:hypothetical protein n=1 Tax=unclassified Streptomyces TaxID=2593676 RepID=UPI00364B4793